MMDALTKARILKLDATEYCPACGAGRLRSSGRHGQQNVFFHCGSHFSTETGRPIVADIPCPGSSNVAAAALEQEVAAAIRGDAA
jgi:hypothetical protein